MPLKIIYGYFSFYFLIIFVYFLKWINFYILIYNLYLLILIFYFKKLLLYYFFFSLFI